MGWNRVSFRFSTAKICVFPFPQLFNQFSSFYSYLAISDFPSFKNWISVGYDFPPILSGFSWLKHSIFRFPARIFFPFSTDFLWYFQFSVTCSGPFWLSAKSIPGPLCNIIIPTDFYTAAYQIFYHSIIGKHAALFQGRISKILHQWTIVENQVFPNPSPMRYYTDPTLMQGCMFTK